MKKILVVSDNPPLLSFFQEVTVTEGINNKAEISFRYSIGNKTPEALIKLGATAIDMKDQGVIKNLINTYDLIFSLHCKQIFPANLVNSVKCVNLHPGLNPHNRGWYPQVFSIINGKPIGATIHLMDEAIDHGEIIDQLSAETFSSDTSLDVYRRVIDLEKQLLKKNLLQIILDNVTLVKLEDEGNYNSIEDFRFLCRLELNKVGTMKEHIDLLRALTHGDFNNAYFFDEQGNKVYVKVVLEKA